MLNNDIENKTKMQTLMDLVSKMKQMQGSSLHDEHPHGAALEIHEAHVEPLDHDDVEKLEEATHTDLDNDNEAGESPEHKAAVLGDEDESEEDDMKLPPELLKLIQQHLLSKK